MLFRITNATVFRGLRHQLQCATLTAGARTRGGNAPSGIGTADIIAEATNPADGTIQTATATFDCPLVLQNLTGNPPTPGSCYPGSQAYSLLATLTIYNEGLNHYDRNWEVTASSATGYGECDPLRSRLVPADRRLRVHGNLSGGRSTSFYRDQPGRRPRGATLADGRYNCTPSDANGNTTILPTDIPRPGRTIVWSRPDLNGSPIPM